MQDQVQNWLVYQPLIVGLGAVVLGTIRNTLLEWYRQSSTHKQAARVLRRALLEELRLAKDAADLNSFRSANPHEGGAFLIPVWDKYRVYDANVAEIGRLQPEEVSTVTWAYGMLHSLPEYFAAIGRLERVEGVVLRAIVDSSHAQYLEQMNKSLSDGIARAIAQLEGNDPEAARAVALLPRP